MYRQCHGNVFVEDHPESEDSCRKYTNVRLRRGTSKYWQLFSEDAISYCIYYSRATVSSRADFSRDTAECRRRDLFLRKVATNVTIYETATLRYTVSDVADIDRRFLLSCKTIRILKSSSHGKKKHVDISAYQRYGDARISPLQFLIYESANLNHISS